jgi:hypothetical protein
MTWPKDRNQIAACHECGATAAHVVGRDEHICDHCGALTCCGYTGCQPADDVYREHDRQRRLAKMGRVFAILNAPPETPPQLQPDVTTPAENLSDARRAELDTLAQLGSLLGIHDAQTLLDIGEVQRLPLPIPGCR